MDNELREQKRRLDEAHDGSKWTVACSSDGTAYIYDEGAEIVATYLTPDAAEAICDAHNTWPAISAALDRAVVLPCKVGDTIWSLTGIEPFPCVINEIRIGKKDVRFYGDGGFSKLSMFGKTWVLTRAQAEAAMEKVTCPECMGENPQECPECGASFDGSRGPFFYSIKGGPLCMKCATGESEEGNG
jgi:hypothetical protein